MHRHLLAAILTTCLLGTSGCLEENGPGPDATDPEEHGPPALRPAGSAVESIAHYEDRGAIHLSFKPLGGECTVLMAAHHVVGNPVPDPWFEVSVDGEYETGSGGDSRTVDARVNAMGVDTKEAIAPVYAAGNEAYWDLMGLDDTFTSYLGLTQRNWTGSTVDVLAQLNHGLLSNGTGATNGGSLRIVVECSGPFVVLDTKQDGEAYLLKGEHMTGETDIAIDPFLLEYRKGSLDLQTTGNETEIQLVTYGSTRGMLRIEGAWEDLLEWNQVPSTLLDDARERSVTGPSGPITLTWEELGVALAGFNVSVWSWEPAKWAPVEDPAWPWE